MASALRSVAPDFSLLPKDRTFGDLLPAFVLPYLAYVAIPGLLSGVLGPDLAQAVRFVVVAALLFGFWRTYAFGPRPTFAQALLGIAVAAAATALWVGLLRGLLALPTFADRRFAAADQDLSLLYAVLRTANSVLLVPLFEELLCRVWAQELAHPVPGGGLLDRMPRPLSAPPLGVRAVMVATAVFALGHNLVSLLPAVLYFLLTTAVYVFTRSFLICVMIHGLTNLAIAGLVMWGPEWRFLWF